MIPFLEVRLHHFEPGTDAAAIRKRLEGQRGAWIAQAGSSLPLAAVLREWPSFMVRQARSERETLSGARTECIAVRPSALHPDKGALVGALTELRILEIHGEQSSQAAQVLAAVDFGHLAERGAKVQAVHDVLIGCRTPAMMLLVSWPNPYVAARAWTSLEARADRRELVEKLSDTLHRPLFESYRHWFMTPIGGVP